MPIIVAVAAVDERGSNRRNISVHGDHHNHIKEVIRDNNDHSEFRAIRDRLEQPVNRKQPKSAVQSPALAAIGAAV